MKISAIKATITQKDLLEAIEEYLDIDGLEINNIEIKELIEVSGSYKKGIQIPFKLKLGLGNIHGNTINIKSFKVAIGKVSILNSIKNYAFKKLLKDFSEYGVVVEKDTISVDLNLISRFIPYVNFKLKSVITVSGALEVELEELEYAPNKKIDKTVIKSNNIVNYTVEDSYSKIRKNINSKAPDKCKKILEYAMIVPDIFALFLRLFKDKRIKMDTKILVGGAIAYLVSPINILPNFIPFIGEIDDIAVAFFVMNKLMNEVPEEIIAENWNGNIEVLMKIKDGTYYISNIVGSRNIEKLMAFIKTLGRNKGIEGKVYEESNHLH